MVPRADAPNYHGAEPGPLLGGFASSLGETKPIEDDSERGFTASVCAILRATGLRDYRQTSDLQAHVEETIGLTLARSGLSPDDIDCVIISSSGDHPGAGVLRDDIRTILAAAGMAHATVFGVGRMACANGLLAISIADMLVRRGVATSCLILCYDRILAEESRLMPPTIGVLSDGAASCVLSTRIDAGFALRAIRFATDLGISDETPEKDFVATFRTIGRKVKALGEAFYAASDTRPGDYALVIMNNLSFSTMRLYSSQLGLNWSLVFTELVGRMSHVFSGDLIINLEAIERDDPERLNRPTLLFANSPSNWIVTAIERRSR